MDYEARRLLSAIVRNVVQMTAEELEPASDDSRYELHRSEQGKSVFI